MTKDGVKYPRMVDEWWKYWNARPGLRAAIDGPRPGDHPGQQGRYPVRVPTGQVFSHAAAVFATNDMADLALLSSAPHYWWAISHASTMGNVLRYTPSDQKELATPERCRAYARRAAKVARSRTLAAEMALFLASGLLGATLPHYFDRNHWWELGAVVRSPA